MVYGEQGSEHGSQYKNLHNVQSEPVEGCDQCGCSCRNHAVGSVVKLPQELGPAILSQCFNAIHAQQV